MILGVTGHRPDKLAVADYERQRWTMQSLDEKLDYLLFGLLRPQRVLTGMAQGIDMCIARICARRSIPFWAYVPCFGQHRLWPMNEQAEYLRLLNEAESHFVVRPGPYFEGVMQIRNEKVVDDATDMLVVFNGSRGGTFNTVKYIFESQKHTYCLDPRTLDLAEWFA